MFKRRYEGKDVFTLNLLMGKNEKKEKEKRNKKSHL
jgi:hypothetical protein